MTGTEIATGVRLILNDSTPQDDGNYRYTNADILFWLNLCAANIRNTYTAMEYDSMTGDRLAPWSDLTDLSQDVPIWDEKKDCLIDGICARCCEMDAGDQRDAARSQYHQDRYLKELAT